MKPQQLSLRSLRAAGFTCESVEWWNSFTKRRHDLFQFADIIAFSASHVVLLVQTTSKANLLARIRKVLANPIAKLWTQCPHRMLRCDGWHKVKHRWVCESAYFDHLGCTYVTSKTTKHITYE